MEKLKYIKLEQEDGSYSDSIPICVDAENVNIEGETNLEETLTEINGQLVAIDTTNDAQDNKISKIERETENTTNRLNNLIIEGTPTEGNAELIDIRIDSDGIKHSSAGDAVRAISSNFESANIVELLKDPININGVDITFENNTITLNGTTTGFTQVDLTERKQIITENQDYNFAIFYESGSASGSTNIASIGIKRVTPTKIYGSLDLRTIQSQKEEHFIFNTNDIGKSTMLHYECAGAGFTFNNLKIKIMLTKGSENKEFIDYGFSLLSKKVPFYYTKQEVDEKLSEVEDKILDIYKKEIGKHFRIAVISDLHYGDYGGYYNSQWQDSSTFSNATYQERAQLLIDTINKYNKESPIDFVLMLGDISIMGSSDDKLKNLKEFIDNYASQLAVPIFYVPGNHDPYINEDWKNVVGYNREFSLETDEYYFICLDSFKPTQTGIEVAYNGFDESSLTFLKSEIKKAGTKEIFICSHYFKETDCPEFWEIFYKTPNIIGRLEGHAHLFVTGNTTKEYSNVNYTKYRLNDGCFSYPGTR